MGLEESGTFPIRFVLGIVIILLIFYVMFQFSQSMLNSIQHLSDKITDFFSNLIPGLIEYVLP